MHHGIWKVQVPHGMHQHPGGWHYAPVLIVAADANPWLGLRQSARRCSEGQCQITQQPTTTLRVYHCTDTSDQRMACGAAAAKQLSHGATADISALASNGHELQRLASCSGTCSAAYCTV